MSAADFAALDRVVRTVLPAILRRERDPWNADRLTLMPAITDEQTAFEMYCVLEAMTLPRYTGTAMYCVVAVQNAQEACAMAGGEQEAVARDFDLDYHIQAVWSCASGTLTTAEMDTLRASAPVAMRRSA